VFPQIKVLAGHRFEPALAWRSNLRNPFHQEVLDDPAAQQVATQPPKLQVATCGSGTGTSWNDAGLFGRIGGMATDDAPIRAGSLRLLAGNPPFRLLWSARAVSYLGDSLGLVALMLHVADATGRALAVALLLLVGDFAPALLGPLAGTLVDRLDRKRVMVGCELVQGVLVAATALWLPPLPWLLVLVWLRALAGQVFQPGSRAAVPALVPDSDLERANAAIGIATNGGETLGPLSAALLLPVLDVRGVLLLDAATFLVSAALLGLLPGRPRPGSGRQARFLADTGAGLRYLWGEPTVRPVALGYFAVVACSGVDDVALMSWPPTRWAPGALRSGCCRPASASGCWRGMHCWPEHVRGSRWLRCRWSALPSAALATCSPGWLGRWRRPSWSRPSAGSALPAWTSPPTPCCSGSCPRPCSDGSSAACTARSASPPRSPIFWAGCCWTGPRRGSPSSSPAPGGLLATPATAAALRHAIREPSGSGREPGG
jgi:MFS family permease